MWSNKYLGIPYLHHGRDENGIDCWGLVRLVYKSEYHIDLPSFVDSYLEDDRARSEELIAQYREGWEEVGEAQEGCIVVLRVMGHLSHVGVCINDHQFLHAQEGSGSSIQDLDGVKWSRRVSGFFRYRENAGVVLNAVPHPLKTERVVMAIVPGTNLEELYTKVTAEYPVAEIINKNTHIFVNGVLIPRPAWTSTVLQGSDVVEYRSVPKDKGTLRMVLTIALVIVAASIAGPLGAELAASMSITSTAGVTAVTYATQAAIVLAGTALINAAFPIRPPTERDPGSSEAQLMVQGGQNQANRYGAIPVVLGRIRMTPPLGASSFITFEDATGAELETAVTGGLNEGKSISYLNMMLAWGYGPLKINEATLQVGPTEWTNYDNTEQVTVSYETSPSLETRTAFEKIIVSDVVQNFSGLELVGASYEAVSVTDPLTGKSIGLVVDEDEWDALIAPPTLAGTYFMRRVNSSGGFVDNNYYSTWSPNNDTNTVVNKINPTATLPSELTQESSPVFKVKLNGWVESTFNQALEKALLAIAFPQGLRTIIISGGDSGKTQGATVEFEIQRRYKLNSTTWQSWPGTGGSNPGTVLPNIVVNRNEKDGFTKTIEYLLDSTYQGTEFRIRRITSDNSEPNDSQRLSHTSVLHSFSGYYKDPNYSPVDWAPLNCTVAKTAIKIKATDQLNGNVDGISAVVQSICRTWTGGTNYTASAETLKTNWSTLAATSNPAALFLHVLTHPANPQKILWSEVTSKVDLAKLAYWYNYCQNYQAKTSSGNIAKALEYNGVLASQRSVLEVLRDICAAGRGSPALKDGKWTINIDEVQPVVVQHFTPHNSWGFESVKALPKYPDAFKIQFYDEEKNYQENEAFLYSAGKSEYNAELFETISLPGVTNKIIAEDFGRWHYAQIKLRPEIYTLNTDIEYLVCNRGDRVKLLHDVPMWGLQSGRISSRVQADVLQLDEELPITENKSYTIRFRGVSNTGTGTNQVLNTERQVKTTFTATQYTIASQGVTLTLGNHPIQVGNRLNITSATTGVTNSTAVVTAVTSTTITYLPTGSPVFVATPTSLTATVKLKDGYYTRVQTTATTTEYEAGPNNLFMFGELQQESQDLIVLAIEPTSGAKNARLTLVDYGVQPAIAGITDGYDIFANYYNYTSLAYFSNITDTPQLQIDDIGDRFPNIMSDRIVSDESVMIKTSTGTFVFAMRIPFFADLDLPKTVTTVQGQIDSGVNENATYKYEATEIDKSTLTFTGVEEAKTYRVRLRYVDRDGRVGSWSPWVSHEVVGKRNPPENVQNFDFLILPGYIKFQWDRSVAPDYDYTIIKDLSATGATWDSGVQLFSGPLTNWIWDEATTGEHVIAARHVDTSGILSKLDAVLNIDYTAIELATVRVELSNDRHQAPANYDGTAPNLLFSGTDISVYQGSTLLAYDGVGTAAGRWKIASITETNVTPGALQSVQNTVSGDANAVIGDLTEFSEDVGNIVFSITGKSLTGIAFELTKTQSFVKVKNGQNSVIYRVITSTKVVYKNSPNSTVAGPFNEIKATGKKYDGTTESNYGWLGVTPYVGTTPGTEQRVQSSETNDIVFSPSSTDMSTKFVIRLYATQTSTEVLDKEEVQVVFKGSVGLNTALVYAYQRSLTALTTNPGAITYNFVTKEITNTALLNGWQKTIPEGTNPLYVTVISASSATDTDETLAADEWSEPVVLTENGINSATIYLYARNDSTTTAPVFTRSSGTASTYTFSTGNITGFPTGVAPNYWSDAIPSETQGKVVWVRQASAANTSETDSIPDSGWSDAQVLSGIAKGLFLTADRYAFNRDNKNTNIPNQVCKLTALKQNTVNGVKWSTSPVVTLYAGATTGAVVVQNSTNIDEVYLRVADFGTNSRVTITCYIGQDSLTDSTSISAVKDGDSGITVVLGNPTHQLQTTNLGVVTYTGSGTTIRVLEGDDYVQINSVGIAANGLSTPGAITSGTGTSTVTIGEHAGISGSNATVTYTIGFTKSNGATSSVVAVQSLSKSVQGNPGASAVVMNLNNDSHVIPAANDGTVLNAAGAVSTATVLLGGTDDSANWTFSAAPASDTSLTYTLSNNNRTVTVTGMAVGTDSAFIDITATRSGYATQTSRFSLSKSKTGNPGNPGNPGATGTTQERVELYISAANTASPPTKPTDVLYTITGTVLGTQTGGTSGWALTMPATPALPGAVYMTTALASTTTPGTQLTLSSWSTPVVVAKNGDPGTDGKVVYAATVYKQTSTVLTSSDAPTGGNFNAVSGALTAPSGWSNTQPTTTTTPTWASDYVFVVNQGTTTNAGGTWSTPYIEAVAGANGGPGPTGPTGTSVAKVYIKTAGQGTSPSAITSTANPPTTPATWSATPVTLTGVEAQWESDGTSTNGTTWTWSTPYLSYFKVNTLEAITTNTGSLSITGTMRSGSDLVNSPPTIAGTATVPTLTGSGAIIYNDGKFGFGNATNYVVWNGTALNIKGDITGSSGTFGGNLDVAGTAVIRGVNANASGSLSANLKTPATPTADIGILVTGSFYGVFANGGAKTGVYGNTTGEKGIHGKTTGSTSSAGVYGEGITGATAGGIGVDATSNYIAVRATASGTGTALYVDGPMTMTNTTVVANLNADKVDGKDASAFVEVAAGTTNAKYLYFVNNNTAPSNTTTMAAWIKLSTNDGAVVWVPGYF
jgi:hypothetical protein